MLQGKSGYGYAIIAVHSRTGADAVVTQLRKAVADLDSSLPLENVRTLEDVTGQQYQMSRIPAELLGVYAICSVLVAMMGLYAVMAFSVIERNREFALRMALGSSRSGIFRLVLQGSASVILVGLVAGGLGLHCRRAVVALHAVQCRSLRSNQFLRRGHRVGDYCS